MSRAGYCPILLVAVSALLVFGCRSDGAIPRREPWISKVGTARWPQEPHQRGVWLQVHPGQPESVRSVWGSIELLYSNPGLRHRSATFQIENLSGAGTQTEFVRLDGRGYGRRRIRVPASWRRVAVTDTWTRRRWQGAATIASQR